MASSNLWEECLKVEIDIDAPWNEGARLEVEDWLTSFQSNEDRQRLFCMGNIVVPLQASQDRRSLEGSRPMFKFSDFCQTWFRSWAPFFWPSSQSVSQLHISTNATDNSCCKSPLHLTFTRQSESFTSQVKSADSMPALGLPTPCP